MNRDNANRDTITGWTNYMKRNPLYFAAMFGERASIEEEAIKIFGKSAHLRVANKMHSHKPRPPLKGIREIARYIGCSRDTVNRGWQHRGLPTFWQDGHRVAYMGKVKGWAIKNRVGVLGREAHATRQDERRAQN